MAVAQRRDARANHERLLGAARAALADEGSAASLQRIARQAGVGIGTLYRHFPTREALVGAVFDEEVERWLAASRRALALDDAWDALRTYIVSILELQEESGMLGAVLGRDSRAGSALAELEQLADDVLERARHAGAIRADFTLDDLRLLVRSFDPLLDGAWRRHLVVVLDGLHTPIPTPR